MNEKLYVGITSQSSDHRLRGSSSSSHEGRANSGDPHPLYVDIRKYGIDKFNMEDITDQTLSRRDALALETSTIIDLKSKGIELYNIDETQAKSAIKAWSDHLKTLSQEERSELSRSTINSPEAIAKRAESRRGKPQFNIRGKNHGRSVQVRLPQYGNIEFDSMSDCVKFLKKDYPFIDTAAVSKISSGYTPKRYGNLIIERL